MGRLVWSYSSLLLIAVALRMVAVTVAAPAADLISGLPGQPKVDFNQYAGYISVGESHGRKLFYYFVEAQNSSATKPLVLWLNGGPGCSSLGGAFSELGPFFPNASGDGLILNGDSWNQVANIIFLEAPVGTGFSYSNNVSDYNTTDLQTAEDALGFLLGWLKEYPEYNTTDFYITGESYAGHYIPYLASAILNYNSEDPQAPILLKGIMMGNPSLDQETEHGYARFEYGWGHGMISEGTYNTLKECNYTASSASPACTVAVETANNQIGFNTILLDEYDVTEDVCVKSGSEGVRLKEMAELVGMANPCIQKQLEKYMKHPEVESALHVETTGWQQCSGLVYHGYNQNDTASNMFQYLAYVASSNLRLWIYSGDQDIVVPMIGTRQIVTSLADNFSLNATSDYQLWLHGSQIGGWSMSWGNGSLLFATVRGAGHMVPQSQPARSLVLFSSFLTGQNTLPLQKAKNGDKATCPKDNKDGAFERLTVPDCYCPTYHLDSWLTWCKRASQSCNLFLSCCNW